MEANRPDPGQGSGDPGSRSRSRIVLAAGLRLPQARSGGAFAEEDAGHLGATLARELLARAELDPALLDEVVVGCVGPPHDQANVGRVIALRAGVPRSVPAYTVGRNCASGMQAVTSAATSILAGRGSLFLALGVEVMSRYPLVLNERATRFFGRLARAKSPLSRARALLGLRPSMLAPRVTLTEGLTDPTVDLIMGATAEVLAREWDVSREEADEFALESHVRAREARERGRMDREIVPHLPLGAKPGSEALRYDDGIRDDQSMEKLAKLRPYFDRRDGKVTVGNSCGITDGAAGLVVTSEDRARSLGLAPLAAVRGWAYAGCDPARMGLGPVHATAKVLDQSGVALSDVGVFEINEAFAAQVLACLRAFESERFARQNLGRERALGEIPRERLNRNGGAIAIGHPVGVTGTRLLLTTALEMRELDCELGLATLCVGGGQGGAVLLERVAA